MKNLVFFTLIAILPSCQQNNRSIWQDFMFKESPQKFIIHTNANTIVKGNKGTIIEIERNSFVEGSGKEVDEVLLTLEEFYRVSDFIKNNLSTQTNDGRLLRSSGMINLKAESNGKEVFLKKDIKVKFPRVQFSQVANLFEGNPGQDGEIQWKPMAQIHIDTSFFRTELIEQEEYGVEKVTIYIDIVVGNDTLEHSKENYDKFKDYMDKNIIEKIEKWDYYEFAFNKLGYINCDIFINKELYPLIIKTDKPSTRVNIILDSLNSVLSADSFDPQRRIFKFRRPKDTPISVLAYAEEGKNTYFKLAKTNADVDSLYVDLIQTDPKDIKEAIESLR